MQLVTLTVPDGCKERWNINTTYLALLSWYQYLKDVDQAKKPSDLASRIGEFVGDDLKRVHTLLIYLDGFNGDLYSKLSLLTHNRNEDVTRLYFIMKSIGNPNYLTHKTKVKSVIAKILSTGLSKSPIMTQTR